MTLNIRQGDLLVVGSEMYPIKAVPNWNMPRMSLSSFLRLATLRVSIRRAAAANGKITPASEAANLLSELRAFPLDPLSGDAAAYAEKSLGLEKPTQLLQTFVSDGKSFVQLFVERKL